MLFIYCFTMTLRKWICPIVMSRLRLVAEWKFIVCLFIYLSITFISHHNYSTNCSKKTENKMKYRKIKIGQIKLKHILGLRSKNSLEKLPLQLFLDSGECWANLQLGAYSRGPVPSLKTNAPRIPIDPLGQVKWETQSCRLTRYQAINGFIGKSKL